MILVQRSGTSVDCPIRNLRPIDRPNRNEFRSKYFTIQTITEIAANFPTTTKIQDGKGGNKQLHVGLPFDAGRDSSLPAKIGILILDWLSRRVNEVESPTRSNEVEFPPWIGFRETTFRTRIPSKNDWASSVFQSLPESASVCENLQASSIKDLEYCWRWLQTVGDNPDLKISADLCWSLSGDITQIARRLQPDKARSRQYSASSIWQICQYRRRSANIVADSGRLWKLLLILSQTLKLLLILSQIVADMVISLKTVHNRKNIFEICKYLFYFLFKQFYKR